jgi:glycosyltransferase involved in cell wall biosynthesis
MMIIIVGPNAGSHMGTGGGVRVALNMAEALLETGYEIGLVAIDGFSMIKLDEIHGTHLSQYEKSGSLKIFYVLGRFKGLHVPFPVKVGLIALFLTRLLSKIKVELMIFHDDVPKPIFYGRWPVKTILYSHFPYMARIAFNMCDPFEAEDRSRMLKEHMMRVLMRPTIYTYKRPDGLLIANSSVTKSFMEKVWGNGIRLLYPPVTLPSLEVNLESKEDLVVVIGTIQPNKRLGDILAGFAMAKSGKLCIIGRPSCKWYFELIKNRIKSLGLEERVQLMTDVDDAQKVSILLRSKAIISASQFEPFGISIIEGMAAGCVPVVFQGEMSGPWVDIC